MGPYRTSMDDLIARVRKYIGDPAGASEQFSGLDIQNICDEHKFIVRYATLRPGPTLQPGSLYDYLDYYADLGNWEANEALSWVDFSTLTPLTADRINGHWTFSNNAGPAGQYPPVYITGAYYDLHAVAADLLEEWAASLAVNSFDFTADGTTLHRSQRVTMLQKAADIHRRKQLATTALIRRSDLAGVHQFFSTGEGGPGDVTGEGS